MSLPVTRDHADAHDQDGPGAHPAALLQGGRSPSGRFIVVPAGERTPDAWLTARDVVDLEEVA